MLTIGQMSKVCGASVRILRHYDKIGLLKPQRTDEISGCRYYEDFQIGAMFLIGRLKWYDFSPTKIQTLLTIPDGREFLRQLYKQRFRLGRQTEYISIATREMGYRPEESERTGDIMSYQNNYEIQIKKTEGQVLVTHRHKISMEEFDTCYGKVYEETVRKHTTINGVIMAVYHNREFNPAYSDVELGVGITERDKADFIVPGCLYAAITHRGPYSGLLDVYGVVMAWVNANGYHMNGIPYEIYRKDQLDELPPDEQETEILLPVERQRTGRR